MAAETRTATKGNRRWAAVQRFVIPLGDAQLLGLPDGEAQDPGGGRRGGFIGLETAEKNLVHRGFEVILVEMVIKS
jgi:hypothetical protein